MKVDLNHLAYLDLSISNSLTRPTEDKNLIVCLVHWDTFNNQVLMIDERNNLIKKSVELLATHANNQPCLLVAPEYFYSRPLTNGKGKEVNSLSDMLNYISNKKTQQFYMQNRRYYPSSIRQVEESTYQQIRTFCMDLSAQYKNLILFPGTIAYRRALNEKDFPKIKQRITENIKHIYNNPPFPEPLLYFNDGNIQYHLQESQTEDHKTHFLGKFKFVARNTSLGFWNGKQIYSQNKLYNFGEIKEGYPKKAGQIDFDHRAVPETIFMPGKYKGRVRFINGFNIASEICADHGRGFLKKSFDQKIHENPISLHILQSAYINPYLKYHCESEGGYFIHASSELEYNSVIRRNGEHDYEKINPYTKETLPVLKKGHATLTFFKLPIKLESNHIDKPKRRMSINSVAT